MKPILFQIAGTGCAAILTLNLGAAPEVPALDPAAHPASPSYESIFPDGIVPLDAQLSWRQRFLGNEIFNSEETLPPTSASFTAGKSADRARPIEPQSKEFDATGVVRQVRASEGKLKIEHGPIDRLGMPAMTMVFRVDDPDQLAGLEKGAEIGFDVDNTAAGFSISRLQPLGAEAGRSLDARGTVRSVRADQGKVKIEHGPIERLGMPGMTMMFIVKNPDDLQMLERDMEVEFDVINGPGGFEITRIRPAAQ